MELRQFSHKLHVKAALPGARQYVQDFECHHTVPHYPKKVMGIDFANPLGLAAGFDKQACMTELPRALGLGFMEVGSFTEHPTQEVRKSSPLGINIAAPAHSGLNEALTHYVNLSITFRHHADFLVINFSSPHTNSLLKQGGRIWAQELFQQLQNKWCSPLCLKVQSEQIPDWLGDLPLDGIVVVHNAQNATDIRSLYSELQPLKILSVGGVMSAKDVDMRLSLGADLVEIFSLLVLHGPRAVRKMVQELWAC